MSRLNIWNEKDIKNKISICIKKEDFGSFGKGFFVFPLSDILFSFYETASIIEEFYSIEWEQKYHEKWYQENQVEDSSEEELRFFTKYHALASVGMTIEWIMEDMPIPPEIFKTQLRALLREATYGNLSIMYPMI